jgi:hypothetical protein
MVFFVFTFLFLVVMNLKVKVNCNSFFELFDNIFILKKIKNLS